LLEKLAALVPLPRQHQVRYGVREPSPQTNVLTSGSFICYEGVKDV
jgi:hypothetical protein